MLNSDIKSQQDFELQCPFARIVQFCLELHQSMPHTHHTCSLNQVPIESKPQDHIQLWNMSLASLHDLYESCFAMVYSAHNTSAFFTESLYAK